MPPRGVTNPKRKRQYNDIKQSARKRGASLKRAEELAARVVNKQRAEHGETKTKSKRTGAKARKTASKTAARTGRKTGARKTTSSRSKTGTRKTAARKTSSRSRSSSSSRSKK